MYIVLISFILSLSDCNSTMYIVSQFALLAFSFENIGNDLLSFGFLLSLLAALGSDIVLVNIVVCLMILTLV